MSPSISWILILKPACGLVVRWLKAAKSLMRTSTLQRGSGHDESPVSATSYAIEREANRFYADGSCCSALSIHCKTIVNAASFLQWADDLGVNTAQ